MAKNIFDQFDEQPIGQVGNIFDQFDEDEHSRKQFFDTSEQAQRARAADERVAKERVGRSGASNMVRDHVIAAAKGIPGGTFLDELNAGVADLQHRAGMGGEPYQDRMDYHAARERREAADAPQIGNIPFTDIPVTTNTLATMAGGMASMAVAPQSVARQMIANPTTTGALWGAQYGAGEGQGSDRVENAATSALWGGVTGFAGPHVGRAVGNSINYAGNKLMPLPFQINGYGKPAVNRLLTATEESGLLNSNTYAARVAPLGDEGMLADLSPRLRLQTAGLASLPGKSSNIVTEAVGKRARGAPSRIEDTVNATMGPTRDLVAEKSRVLSSGRAQAGPHYDDFYNSPIPMTPDLQAVMARVPAMVQREAQRLASVERAPGNLSPGMQLDYIKRAIDDVAYDPKTPRARARAYKQLSRDLLAATDNALSPGNPAASSWAIAREIAGDGLRFEQGLKEGGKAFSRATHPDQQAADIARMSYVQRHGYDEGARGAIRDIMGNAATKFGPNGDAAAMRNLSSDYGRQRVANVVGQQNADEIAARIHAEQEFAKTKTKVLDNSESAARLAAQKEFPNPVEKGTTDLPQGAVHAASMFARKIWNAAQAGRINEANARIAADAAEMLVAQGVRRDQIARGLRQYAQSQGQNRRLAALLDGLAQAVLRGSTPAASGALASSPNR